MKISLREEDEARRQRLADIYDHVGEIAGKIAAMDDPLPEQLQRSIPDYEETLRCHASKLKDSKCSIAIAGTNLESSCSRSLLQLALSSGFCWWIVTLTLHDTNMGQR